MRGRLGEDDMKDGDNSPPQAPPPAPQTPAPRTSPRLSTRVKLEELPPILDEKVDLDGYVNLLLSSPADEFESMKSELLRMPAVNPKNANSVYGTTNSIEARELLAIRAMIELVPDITQAELQEVITDLRLNPLDIRKTLYSKIKKYIRETYTV